MNDDQSGSPIDETVQHLVELHEAHQRQATRLQRVANRVTAALGRPGSVAVMVVVVIGWITGNYLATRLGLSALEQFPFPDLAFVATVAALIVALLILTSQRHDQALADKRAQLTLQIAILSDRKIGKLISMLDEQRRDNPLLPSRHDPEAEELAKPVDPLASLEQIEATRSE